MTRRAARLIRGLCPPAWISDPATVRNKDTSEIVITSERSRIGHGLARCIMWRVSRSRLAVAVQMFFLFIGFAFCQSPPTAEPVKEKQAKFRTQREQAAKEKAPTAVLDAADQLAARGGQELSNGHMKEAESVFREARWRLPYRPADLPANVSRVIDTPRLRHADQVLGLAYSPDGKLLATASKDGTVIIWDLDNGHAIRTYRGHSQSGRSVAWSANGKRIASRGGSAINRWQRH